MRSRRANVLLPAPGHPITITFNMISSFVLPPDLYAGDCGFDGPLPTVGNGRIGPNRSRYLLALKNKTDRLGSVFI